MRLDFVVFAMEGIDVDSGISIGISQFGNGDIGRRRCRKYQSLAVRELLTSTLQRLFGRDKSASWSLVKSSRGKPFLQGDDSPSISIAHSQDWVVCAVAPSATTIGVDVEVIKLRDWEAYCDDVLHPLEAPWVLGEVGNERNIRGLICWCRKEAIVKAMGVGMVISPSKIGFSPEGTLIAFPEEFGSPVGWQTYSTVAQSKAVIAVAWKC
jgi:phosphopantetheinyl transferase